MTGFSTLMKFQSSVRINVGPNLCRKGLSEGRIGVSILRED